MKISILPSILTWTDEVSVTFLFFSLWRMETWREKSILGRRGSFFRENNFSSFNFWTSQSEMEWIFEGFPLKLDSKDIKMFLFSMPLYIERWSVERKLGHGKFRTEWDGFLFQVSFGPSGVKLKSKRTNEWI